MRKRLTLWVAVAAVTTMSGLAGAVAAAGPAAAAGVTLSWTGNGNWSTAANWSPAEVPVNGDSLVFPSDNDTFPNLGPSNNDMTGLSINTVSWVSGTDGCNGPTSVSGNAFTLTGGIDAEQWCYNSPPIPLDTPVVLGPGSHTLTGVEFDDQLSGPGEAVITGPVDYDADVSNTYTGGTEVSRSGGQGGVLSLEPSDGAVAVPHSASPMTLVGDSWVFLESDGAIAPTEAVDVTAGSVFETTLASASVPFASLQNDGILDLNGYLDVGNLYLRSDGTVYPWGYLGLTAQTGYAGIIASGQVALAGSLNLADDTNVGLPPAMLLVDNSSSHAISGTFAGLPQGATISTGPNQTPAAYTVSYNAGASHHSVGLTSAENTLTVDIETSGGATGTVTSSPSGISCPGTCTAVFPAQTPVTLTMAAGTGDVVDATQTDSYSGDECSQAAGTYGSVSCTVEVNGGTAVYPSFTLLTALASVGNTQRDTADQALVDVGLDGCFSTGAATYQFTLDGSSLGPPGADCVVGRNLALGNHTLTVAVASSDGARTSSQTIDFNVSPTASFSWTVDPIPYGNSTVLTTAHLDACDSTGVAKYVWSINPSTVTEDGVTLHLGPFTTTNCKLPAVPFFTGRSYGVTLTVVPPSGPSIHVESNMTVNAVYDEPTSNCSVISVSSDACWREGLDWFGDAFGVSGNAMRAPDYAVLELSGGAAGITGGFNIAVTCDGNIYAGGAIGVGVSVLPVSAVMAWGYVGDPTTVAPSLSDIDSFVNGETDNISISGVGAGFTYVHSPNASGPTEGIEYFGGLTGPGIDFTSSYSTPDVSDQPAPAGEQCTNGVTASNVWQALVGLPVQSGAGVPGFNPLNGQSPTVGQGVTVLVTVPAGTFADGTDVVVSVHSSPMVTLATTAANKDGALGVLVRLPAALASGKHTLILTGISPHSLQQTKTLTMGFDIKGQGYYLAGRDGAVTASGAVAPLAGFSTPSTDPVVGIAATPDDAGYFAVTSNGAVHTAGDAVFYGDLLHLPGGGADHVDDVVALAPTTDGKGYWLIGADGGMFAFGDARYHGSLPGLGIRVSDVVGMVASPSGAGYLIVGSDGGVFAFGHSHYFGSLPALGVKVSDVRAILPAPGGTGYVLVGSDGGAFSFGHGAPFKGSLPGRGIHVTDVVGLALTPDGGGYWMAGSDGTVYGFGDAKTFPASRGLAEALPIAAIGGS